MNRRENRIYKIQMKVLTSKRWQKMLQKIDIGVPNPKPPTPKMVEVSKRLKRYLGVAGSELKISYDYYKTAPYKSLKDTVTHELIHFYLMDNGIYDHHGKIFRRCARAMGLDGYSDKTWSYKHVCGGCGSSLKDHKKRRYWHCQYCNKSNVLASELRKINKIAELKSYCFPVQDLSKFVIFKAIKKIE